MLRVLHLTDTHLRPSSRADDPPNDVASAAHRYTGASTVDRAERVVDAALAACGADGLDFVVHTGDVTESTGSDGCGAGAELLARTGAPFLVAPGNHDPVGELRAELGDRVADPVRHVDLGSWRIVVATSARQGEHRGAVPPATLAVLEEVVAGDRPVLLGCHHPPLSPCGDPSCVIANAWELLDLLDRHPNVRAVVTGHLHVADEVVRGGVRFLLSPSTALQLRHRHPLADHNRGATPAGARLLALGDDGSVESDLIWVDRVDVDDGRPCYAPPVSSAAVAGRPQDPVAAGRRQQDGRLS